MNVDTEDMKTTPREIEERIAFYTTELQSAERRYAERHQAIARIGDHGERTAEKRALGSLAAQLEQLRSILQRLRDARQQALKNADLVKRGGVIQDEVWPELSHSRGERF